MTCGNNYSGARGAFAGRRRRLIVKRPRVGDVLVMTGEQPWGEIVTVTAVHCGGRSLTVRDHEGCERDETRAPDGFWTRQA